jgi:hypothetical protein
MLIVVVNEEGKVIEAKELYETGTNYGKMGDVLYEKAEQRSILGARLYTPNGCCWIKTPNGWKCLPC